MPLHVNREEHDFLWRIRLDVACSINMEIHCISTTARVLTLAHGFLSLRQQLYTRGIGCRKLQAFKNHWFRVHRSREPLRPFLPKKIHDFMTCSNMERKRTGNEKSQASARHASPSLQSFPDELLALVGENISHKPTQAFLCCISRRF